MINPKKRPAKVQIIIPNRKFNNLKSSPLINGKSTSIIKNIRNPHLSPCVTQLYSGGVKFKGFENFSRWIDNHFLFQLSVNHIQTGNVKPNRIKLVRFLRQGIVFPHLSQYNPNQFLKTVLFWGVYFSAGWMVLQCGHGMKVLSARDFSLFLSMRVTLGTLCPSINSLNASPGLMIQWSIKGFFQVQILYFAASNFISLKFSRIGRT